MQLISEKLTRAQLEERLQCGGKEATATIKNLVRGGQLQYCLSPVDPFKSEKYQRTYFFVAQTVSIIPAESVAA